MYTNEKGFCVTCLCMRLCASMKVSILYMEIFCIYMYMEIFIYGYSYFYLKYVITFLIIMI